MSSSIITANEIALGLPKRVPIKFSLGHDSGWASHYGGIEAIKKYTGLLPSLPIEFNATWQHAPTLPWIVEENPLSLLYGLRHPSDKLILVANQVQKSALESLGYGNVHAVGCPWVYSEPRIKPNRIPGSILVMPPHTIDNAPFESLEEIELYSNYIAKRYMPLSSLVCVSLHMSCIRNGLWVDQLLKHGMTVVGGADHGDANSYQRIWHLLSIFETLYTSCIGSHVLYALAAGCRVCIEGPKVTYTKSQMLKDQTHLAELKQGFDRLSNTRLSYLEMEFEKAFSTAHQDQALGERLTGKYNKKSPNEFREILGWSKRGQIALLPSSIVRKAKHIARDSVFWC